MFVTESQFSVIVPLVICVMKCSVLAGLLKGTGLPAPDHDDPSPESVRGGGGGEVGMKTSSKAVCQRV